MGFVGMSASPFVSIVVPAYNEAEGVSQTLEKLLPTVETLRRQYPVEVIFIDDGSRDETKSLLEAATAGDDALRVVSHGVNKGLGAAIRTGFEHAAGEIVVTTDFDGTYKFETIPDLIALLQSSGADMVTASPYHPDGSVVNVPRYRLLFSYGASLLYRILVSRHIHTWTALFRAYRRPVIEAVSFESTGFLAGTEILVSAIQQGFRVVEYPTDLYSRTYGQSSIKILKVTLTHLKYQGKLLVSKLGFLRSAKKVTRIAPGVDRSKNR